MYLALRELRFAVGSGEKREDERLNVASGLILEDGAIPEEARFGWCWRLASVEELRFTLRLGDWLGTAGCMVKLRPAARIGEAITTVS